MKSAAEVFIEIFGIPGKSIRPAKLESILMSMLYTLNTAGLLNQAAIDVEQYTEYDIETLDGMDYIQAVTSTPEMIGLFNKQKSMQLLLRLIPQISIIEEYGVATIESDDLTAIINRKHKTHVYAEIKKILKHINALNLGYKVIQRPRDTKMTEFHIVKYSSREHLLELLNTYDLQNPSILDKVLT